MASRGISSKVKVPDFKGESKKICIITSKWNFDITSKLLKGAKKVLLEKGIKAKDIITEEVPGSFEIPLGAQWMISRYNPDAVICLGCIIKGETPHFDFIADAVSNGIMKLNLSHKIPVIFGVLTTNTLKQAKERSGGKHGNKGKECAITALQMLELSEWTKIEF